MERVEPLGLGHSVSMRLHTDAPHFVTIPLYTVGIGTKLAHAPWEVPSESQNLCICLLTVFRPASYPPWYTACLTPFPPGPHPLPTPVSFFAGTKPDAQRQPGVEVLRFGSSMTFANKDVFRRTIIKVVEKADNERRLAESQGNSSKVPLQVCCFFMLWLGIVFFCLCTPVCALAAGLFRSKDAFVPERK